MGLNLFIYLFIVDDNLSNRTSLLLYINYSKSFYYEVNVSIRNYLEKFNTLAFIVFELKLNNVWRKHFLCDDFSLSSE